MHSWLANMLDTLDVLARAPDGEAFARASDTLATLTETFNTLGTEQQHLLAPHLAGILTKLTLTAESLGHKQAELAAELTTLRTRAVALQAYGGKR